MQHAVDDVWCEIEVQKGSLVSVYRGRIAKRQFGRRPAQRVEEVVGDASPQIDHSDGQDLFEVALPPAVAPAIDRHVDCLHGVIDGLEVFADVIRVLRGAGCCGEKRNHPPIGRHE